MLKNVAKLQTSSTWEEADQIKLCRDTTEEKEKKIKKKGTKIK